MVIGKVQVDGVCMTVSLPDGAIPRGITGGKIAIAYTDPIWADLNKTVVFRCGEVTKDVLNVRDVVTIPREVTAFLQKDIHMGIYGVDAQNNLAIPTVWAKLGTVKAAADPSGDDSTDGTLPVFAQLDDRVEELERKAELVVDPELVEKTVLQYLEENPPGAGMDGISCTHAWEGTVLTVTSASGTSSADLKGEKGEKGDIGPARKLGGTAIFFGDSLSVGYNNNDRSFVDVVSETGMFDTVIKHATSGSGFSTYGGVMPGPSLEEYISTCENEIRTADYIFVEYGANDGYAIANGMITLEQAKEKAVSAIASIRQLNSTAHIVYLAAAADPYIVAAGIRDDAIRESMYNALLLKSAVSRQTYVPVVAMFDGVICSQGFLSDDGLHPNEAGHRLIAEIVAGKMFQTEPDSYSWTVAYSDTMYQNFEQYYWYALCGGNLTVEMPMDAGAIVLGTVKGIHSSMLQIVFDGRGADSVIRSTLALTPTEQTVTSDTLADQEYVCNYVNETILGGAW